MISASLKAQLQQFGYEISGSSIRGETCLEEIEQLSNEGKEPEIILMDIHLRGDMDGIETARLINEKFNCAIIFLTGQSSKEVYERSFKIKPFGYLLKPIDMEQTKMTIEIAAYQRNLEIENKLYQKDLELLLEKRSLENRALMDTYHEIFNNSLMGLTIVQDDFFVFSNKRTAEIFGFSLEKFLSCPIGEIMELFHPEDREKTIELLQPGKGDTDLPKHMQIRLVSEKGQPRLIDMFVKTVQFRGAPARHVTFLDISAYVK